MAHLTHHQLLPPALFPSLTRSRSQEPLSPISPTSSRSATDPPSPSPKHIRRSSSTTLDSFRQAPRAAQTLPTSRSSLEKRRAKERDKDKDKEKQEKHRRLHLHTHFPHPHLPTLSAGLHPEPSYHRSRSHDNRHRRTQTDTQTPTILINDSRSANVGLPSLEVTRDGPSEDKHSHHLHHHHYHHAHQNHNSKDDLKSMLRPTRPGLRPRAVSDSSRPSFTAQASSNPLNSQTSRNSGTPQKTSTTVPSISSALDRKSALEKSQPESATPVALSALRQSAAKADAELRSRLSNISKSSTEITRRLDYTYYNLLEKVGQLVSTVSSFQSLLAQTHAMSEGFQEGISDASGRGGLQADLKKGAEEFEMGFEERRKRVEELEKRIKDGKNQAAELGERLEGCRKRVKDFESKEQRWREKVSWRLRVFWICSALLLSLALGIGIWWENRAIRTSEGNQHGLEGKVGNYTFKIETEKEKLLDRISTGSMPEDVQDLLRSVVAGQEQESSPRKTFQVPLSSDEERWVAAKDRKMDVLTIFDDL